jgi:hypothetical protein
MAAVVDGKMAVVEEHRHASERIGGSGSEAQGETRENKR